MTNSGRLIYLHGFRSSPASFKAVWLHQRLQELGKSAWFACPPLPPSPYEAIQLIRRGFDLQPDDTLVGSSLGGFYATYLAEHTGCRAVLLNPAIDPAHGLRALVGKHKMYHSDDAFEFRAEYLHELRELEIPILTFLPRYFLIAAQGDEVLDWRTMQQHYQGARQLILPGSDHGLSDFAQYGDQVVEFSGLLPRVGSRPVDGLL
jgi:uncharacterized protein